MDIRYFNEQILFLGFLAHRGIDVGYPCAGAVVKHSIARSSESLISENFVVLEPWQLGVTFSKLAPVISLSSPESYMTYDQWRDVDRALRP